MTDTKKENKQYLMDNRIVLKGNLGAAPEQRQSADGKGFITFSIYKDNDYVNKDGEVIKRDPDILEVIIFENMKSTYQFAKRLQKGDWVRVTSEPSTNTVTDEEGKSRKFVSFRAYDIELLDAKDAA